MGVFGWWAGLLVLCVLLIVVTFLGWVLIYVCGWFLLGGFTCLLVFLVCELVCVWWCFVELWVFVYGRLVGGYLIISVVMILFSFI